MRLLCQQSISGNQLQLVHCLLHFCKGKQREKLPANMTTGMNILDLSIDELELIFSKIESIVDQNNLALAHPKLHEAFLYYHRDIFKTICLQTAKSVECRNKLQWCGSSITSIYDGGYCMTGKGLELAQEFCPNLKSINICITRENIKAAQLYIPQMTKLVEIQLRGPCFIAILLECLQELPQLERLGLWDFNFDLIESRLKNISGIIILSLIS